MPKDQDLSTRKVLLTLMKTKGSLSVNEMAKELGITEMAVRRHLNTLERDGFIEPRLVRQPMGRPVHLYSLTKTADELFPKNYQSFTLDLLSELELMEGEDTVQRLFERRKLKMQGRYEPHMAGKNLEERISALADIQNNNGYMVDWEKDEEGNFKFKEYNCPISQVADQYQHACACELELFRTLLGAEVERTECLSRDGAKCMYLIKPEQLASKTNGKPAH